MIIRRAVSPTIAGDDREPFAKCPILEPVPRKYSSFLKSLTILRIFDVDYRNYDDCLFFENDLFLKQKKAVQLLFSLHASELERLLFLSLMKNSLDYFSVR